MKRLQRFEHEMFARARDFGAAYAAAAIEQHLKDHVVRAFTLCLIALTAAGSGACASRAAGASTAATSSDWSAVEALPPGSNVVVERRSGGAVSGATRAITSASIEVDNRDRVLVLARADVARVLRTRNVAGLGAARGLAIGGAVGVLQALLLTKSDRLVFAGMFSAVWGSVGAALGAIDGAGRRETTVIYSVDASNPLSNIRMRPTPRLLPESASATPRGGA